MIVAAHVTSALRVVAHVGAVVSKVAVPVAAEMSRAKPFPVAADAFAPSAAVMVFVRVVVPVDGTAVAE